MSGAQDPFAALLMVKLAEDPKYLEKILAQAAGLVQPLSKEPTTDLKQSQVPSPSNEEEIRGDSRSIERTLSNALTVIIEYDQEHGPPTCSLKDASSQAKTREIPSSPIHSS